MEDRDWTDLPSTSAVIIDEIYADSSPEINNVKEDRSLIDSENDILKAKSDRSESEVNTKDLIKMPSNKKQELESCPICLSSFEDRSFLDQCFHSFCFCCILQWCEVVQTCPLCKAGFASVIHNVKSMQDYEQHIVEKKKESEQPSNNARLELYNERGFNEHGERFRYRTTRDVRSNFDNNNRRSSEQHLENSTSRRRREGWGSEATARRHSSRTRARIRGIEKRRQVYAFNLRATSTSEHGKQRSRNISSQFYKMYQGCTHRLIPWLGRDLKVLLGDSDEEVNFLMEFILSLITRIDMDSPEFLEEVRPFLLQTTEHFVHELLSFAKAPLDMVAYDESVVYPWPEENSRACAYRQIENNINEEMEGRHSSRISDPQITGGTPLSRCEWSDTPAGLHQVLHVQDSPVQNGEIPQPFAPHLVIEIRESTDSSEKMDDDEKSTEHRHSIVSRPEECIPVARVGSSLKPLDALQGDSHMEKEQLNSKEHKTDSNDHIHQHIHKHVHKHKHKHKHKHRHKHKRHHARHEARSRSGNDSSSIARTSSSLLQSTQTQVHSSTVKTEANCVGQVHSPSLDDMLKEIEELNWQIQQHEEHLLSLSMTER